MIARTIAILGIALCMASVARADETTVVFTVGGDKDAGKAHAEAAGGKWGKSLTKGFKSVSKQLEEGGAMTVILKVAAGEYDGDLGSGAYELPSFRNPEATLILQGGWSEDFSARDPFGTPSSIVTVEDRHQPLWKFYGSRPVDQDVLHELVIDGFVFDVQKSNRYDSKTNSLLKGSSSSHVVLAFGHVKVDRFELRNSVFVNSPHRTFETLLRPANPETEFVLYNDIFLNCVIPVKATSAMTRGGKVKRFLVDHCSFIANWAYNPDAGTSNPAALEIGNAHEVEEVHVTNSLFFSNFGGAILALSNNPPAMTVNSNNFVGNGLLHGQTEPEAVAMIVSAGGKKQPIDVDTIEDVDFIDEAEDNVSIAPGIAISLGSPLPVDASQVEAKVSWQNDLRRLLGRNLEGGQVAIKDYAPLKQYDPKNPPVPTHEEAKAYGASPAHVK